jgi:hypothetical protein
MSQKEWHVLSNDVSKGVVETSEILTVSTMFSRMGMWGEAMFGDDTLLGSGTLNRFLSNVEKNITALDVSKNVDRRNSTLFLATLLTRPGMWGEERFGDEDILGTGNLNSFEG